MAILICFPLSIQALAATTIQYTYDNLNRLTKVVYGNGMVQQYGYDEAGNRVSFLSTVSAPPALTLNPVTTPTNSASQAIGGTTDAGATVTIAVNGGAEKPATVAGTNWTFMVEDLITGINTIQVTASNSEGFTTVRTAVITSNARQLTVILSGTGGGTVTSNPAGISSMTGSIFAFFDLGSTVTLLPTPDFNSLFINWSGDCTGSGACQVEMDSIKSVTAAFNYIDPVRIPGPTPQYFSSIGVAYLNMLEIGTIQARDYEFSEDLLLNKGISLYIDGGYDTAYQSYKGYTTLKGILTISSGSLAAGNLVVK